MKSSYSSVGESIGIMSQGSRVQTSLGTNNFLKSLFKKFFLRMIQISIKFLEYWLNWYNLLIQYYQKTYRVKLLHQIED